MKPLWDCTVRILLGALLLSGSAIAADSPPAAEGGPGVWHKHQYSFLFMGFTSTYSCDGLADQVQRLLLAAGARKDSKSLPGLCSAGYGHPDKFARAELTFYTLGPVGPEDANAPRVDGVWKPVAFSEHSPLQQVGTSDCELIEQFRNNILPMFTTRNVDNRTSCIPHQESGSVIGLDFESFVAAPVRGAGAKPK